MTNDPINNGQLGLDGDSNKTMSPTPSQPDGLQFLVNTWRNEQMQGIREILISTDSSSIDVFNYMPRTNQNPTNICGFVKAFTDIAKNSGKKPKEVIFDVDKLIIEQFPNKGLVIIATIDLKSNSIDARKKLIEIGQRFYEEFEINLKTTPNQVDEFEKFIFILKSPELWADSKNPENWLISARRYLPLNRIEEAIKCLRECLRLDKNHLDGIKTIGSIFSKLVQYKEFSKADDLLEEFAEFPSASDWFNFAMKYLNFGEVEKAIEYLLKCLAQDKQHADAIDNLESVWIDLYSNGKKTEADGVWSQLEPFLTGSKLLEIGDYLSIKGNYNEAKTIFLKALRLDPKDPNPIERLEQLVGLFSLKKMTAEEAMLYVDLAEFYADQKFFQLAQEKCDRFSALAKNGGIDQNLIDKMAAIFSSA